MKISLLFVFLLLSLSVAARASGERTVAVTFDDLPFAAVPSDDDATLLAMTIKLLGDIHAQGVPAVGFVNEAKLYRQGTLDEGRVRLLRLWLSAGIELGNHTYSHLSLNHVSLELFEADLLRGERITRPLMGSAGMRLRWFRYPYLHLGRTVEVRSAFREFLTARGYTIAPVTVNSAEWLFALAYARAQAAGDRDAARQIGEAYVPYMASVFEDTEVLAFDLLGRNIPLVLLLHANTLNADYFSALVSMLKRRGYRFVTLDEALRDPVYRSPIDADGHDGESWLELLANQAGLPSPKMARLPKIVRQWAGPGAYRGY